jgi:hypothetical protein
VHDELSQFGITSVNVFIAAIALLAADTAGMAKRSSHREPAPLFAVLAVVGRWGRSFAPRRRHRCRLRSTSHPGPLGDLPQLQLLVLDRLPIGANAL